MNYKIIATPRFKRELKRLVKKYRSLKEEYADLVTKLEQNPITGDPLGHDCYKVRLAIATKGKGKSGGARVVTHVVVKGTTVFLLFLYDKSEMESITEKQLLQLIKGLE